MENWNIFFGLLKKVKLHRGDFGKRGKFPEQQFISTNFRMPVTLRSTIEKDLRDLNDSGHRISLNDYLLLLIMTSANYTQNEKGEFKHKRKVQSVGDYLNGNKPSDE